MAGVCQADYLTSADQAISDWLIQDSISRTDEAIIKSQFGDTGLA